MAISTKYHFSVEARRRHISVGISGLLCAWDGFGRTKVFRKDVVKTSATKLLLTVIRSILVKLVDVLIGKLY